MVAENGHKAEDAQPFEGYTYLDQHGRGYAISHVKELHRQPHLWRVENPAWSSVATFKNRAEAEAFRDWFHMIQFKGRLPE